jgi:hypothetical protein
MGDPGPEMRRMILSLVVHADRRFQDAFAHVLTHLGPAERWWRFRSTVALAVSHHVHQAQLAEIAQVVELPPEAGQAGREERLAWMVAFLAGALRAPATADVGAVAESGRRGRAHGDRGTGVARAQLARVEVGAGPCDAG